MKKNNKKMTAKKRKVSNKNVGDSSFKTMLYFLILGVSLATYAHTNFSTKSEIKEIKSDLKSDISEIKYYLKDFNDKLYDIHKVLINTRKVENE